MIDRVFLASTSAAAAIFLVTPNALRFVSLPLFVVAAATAALKGGWTQSDLRVFVAWLASAAVTVAYLLVAAAKGYTDALPQVLFVYIVSPALWLLVGSALLKLLPSDRILAALVQLGAFGMISVYIYCWVFIVFGPGPLTWLISEPNAVLTAGSTGIAMHVFGPLLFICAGFFAFPAVVEGRARRIVFGTSMVLTTVLSGRSALFVAIMVGLAIRLAGVRGVSSAKVLSNVVVVGVLAAVGLGIAGALGQNFANAVVVVLNKIAQGGGPERLEQGASLIDGIIESRLLGAGHGVNASTIRSVEYPWRYELVWHATVFRVGLVGALVYMVPAFVIVACYLAHRIRRGSRGADDFMFAGAVAILLATATNPYLESFDFQWMYALPFVYFMAQLQPSSTPACAVGQAACR